LRQVFHLQDLSAASASANGQRYDSYVAKVAINPNENPDTYFRDVEMQAVAAKFAKLYNSYNPPRRVEFLEAWILQLIPSTLKSAGEDGDEDDFPEGLSLHGTICGVEPFIAGEYHKHNNNFGYVSELERNTPQAFSHFTFEASGEQILVVDIQGVGDHYTDPQIHTRRGKEFGKGNLSVRGFERFLGSHRCNPICRYLKLPLINPKDDDPLRGNADPKGTYMNQPRVDKVDSVLCHYYTDSKAFQRYRAAASKQEQREVETSPKSLAYYLRGSVQDEAEGDAKESDSASKHAAIRALREMRYDQRSCSFFFCGAGQQCVIS
jgi:elongation factor 2 kinase